jgi:hypothetical protein
VAYRRFVEAGLGEASPWRDLVGDLVLGTTGLIARCKTWASQDESLAEIASAQRSIGRATVSELQCDLPPNDKRARNEAMAVAYLRHGYRMTEMAAFLGVHDTTVSRAVQEKEGA